MLSPAEAEAAIRAHASRCPTSQRRYPRLAGAVLREPIVATRDQPPFDRVTMDGIAFAYAAFERGRREFRVAGTQAAGAAPLTLARCRACFEVMTGAMLPSGCDCVVPVEKISLRDGVAHVARRSPRRRADLNVHTRGLDVTTRRSRCSNPARVSAPPRSR